ncbi:8554_t:CDS:2 [Rhizophagus irregularis]|nr:8554_t:CDS:2 [Rhizophagus irregularis]
MKLLIFALFLSSLVISVFSQEQPVDLGAVTVPYKTAKVPPNNGTWKFCSDTSTKYVSFGIATPGKIPSTLGAGKGISAQLESPSGFSFIDSLSCHEKIVTVCDQDTGDIPIGTAAKYCLSVTNPFSNPQTINVAFSGSDTVFEKGGFTSPNKSGGNNKPFSSASIISSNIYLMFTCLILYFLI